VPRYAASQIATTRAGHDDVERGPGARVQRSAKLGQVAPSDLRRDRLEMVVTAGGVFEITRWSDLLVFRANPAGTRIPAGAADDFRIVAEYIAVLRT